MFGDLLFGKFFFFILRPHLFEVSQAGPYLKMPRCPVVRMVLLGCGQQMLLKKMILGSSLRMVKVLVSWLDLNFTVGIVDFCWNLELFINFRRSPPKKPQQFGGFCLFVCLLACLFVCLFVYVFAKAISEMHQLFMKKIHLQGHWRRRPQAKSSLHLGSNVSLQNWASTSLCWDPNMNKD